MNHPKSDPRLVELFMPCVHCRHRTHIGNPYGYSEHSTCAAFPAGIPYPIQIRHDTHAVPLPWQEGTAVYDSEAYNYPDGRNRVTFAGAWVTEEEYAKDVAGD